MAIQTIQVTHVSQIPSGHMGISEFCEKHKLQKYTVYNWRSKDRFFPKPRYEIVGQCMKDGPAYYYREKDLMNFLKVYKSAVLAKMNPMFGYAGDSYHG